MTTLTWQVVLKLWPSKVIPSMHLKVTTAWRVVREPSNHPLGKYPTREGQSFDDHLNIFLCFIKIRVERAAVVTQRIEHRPTTLEVMGLNPAFSLFILLSPPVIISHYLNQVSQRGSSVLKHEKVKKETSSVILRGNGVRDNTLTAQAARVRFPPSAKAKIALLRCFFSPSRLKVENGARHDKLCDLASPCRKNPHVWCLRCSEGDNYQENKQINRKNIFSCRHQNLTFGSWFGFYSNMSKLKILFHLGLDSHVLMICTTRKEKIT